ncbi:alpha/beta hydrolase [Sorangium sp. So ce302]|uniref:alpha/beta hydrolase fold domain-containing protein n=1 Tax=Sorangium sp. So ce302 TaxID=3133297 RepID=UPI003F61DCD9
MIRRHPLTLAAAAALLAWLSGCAGAQATAGRPRPPLEAASTSAAETPAAARVIVERGVEYTRAGGEPLLADVLRPDPPVAARLPAVVYIHGGSWKQGTREQGHEFLPQLVATGRYVGVTIDHRFVPAFPWPAQLHDAKAAIRWLRAASEQYGVDPRRIAVWGESSGGQIASVLGTTGGEAALEGDLPLPQGFRPPGTPLSSRVQAVVDFCGPTDMADFFASATTPEAVADMHGRLDPLFGGPPPERADLARSASAIHHVDAQDPPFLLMHGTRDDVVPFRLSAAMHEALSRAGVPSVLVPVADWGHGFRGAEIDRRVLAFLDRHLWHKAAAVSGEPVRAERTPD